LRACTAVASRSASECQEKYEEQFERVEREYALDADAENFSQLNDSNVAPAESGLPIARVGLQFVYNFSIAPI
jgi:hypothetical protein